MENTQPLKRQSLPEQVAARLHGMIIDGTYAAGQQLPHQRDLAKQLGVSTAVVRESLALLASGSVIWSRAGQGTFVSDGHRAMLRYPTWTGEPTSEAEIAEATEARNVLEAAITRLAALRRTEEGISRLTARLAAMEAHGGDGERFASADLAFHLELAEIAGNRPLHSALASLRGLIHADIVARASRQIADQTIGQALSDHRAVLAAVADGDPDAAERVMAAIIERALQAHPAASTRARRPTSKEARP
jgi:GntR family transcriptional regulator, transcriptional repressor for pyruvate dehydrogenase complex